MSSAAQLDRYAADPWPEWQVPRGNLTPGGAQLAGYLGTYWREHYRSLGLLAPGDCAGVWFHANKTQRTVATAEAVAHALLPSCTAAIDTVPDGSADPLFDAVSAGVAVPDYAVAEAAVLGRIGNQPAAWTAAQWGAVVDLQRLMLDCTGEACQPLADQGKQLLTAIPTTVARGKGSDLVALDGPLPTASGLTESLMMAYADGVPLARLAGGRLTEQRLLEAGVLHGADMDLRLRTPYIARMTTSYLARRLLDAVQGGDLLAKPDKRMVVLVGHDGNLIEFSGLLSIDWLVPGYQPNQVPPGGALIFERWTRADGKEVVRLRFEVQSLHQMHGRIPLGANEPPLSAPVFIPGCSESGPSYDCSLDGFQGVMNAAIDPASAGP